MVTLTQKSTLAALMTGLLLCGCANGQIGRPVLEADGGKAAGTEGAPCFPNKTCFSGLACLSNLCVKLPDAGKNDSVWQDSGTINGFGQLCSPSKACNSGLVCAVTKQGSTSGFCSKYCSKAGAPCVGGPSGTQAYCLIGDGKGNLYCLFICLLKEGSGKTTTYPCPGLLKCTPVRPGEVNACME